MANAYTPKLNLAKPAHGDVDWHIPINGNWDKIDTELDKALKISGTTIDADKNWGGKSITNMNSLTLTAAAPNVLLVIYPTDTVIASSAGAKAVSLLEWTALKSAKVEHLGMVRVKWTVTVPAVTPPWTRVTVDGIPYGELTSPSSQTTIRTLDVPVHAGATISIEGKKMGGAANPTVKNVQICGSVGCVPYSTRTPTVTVTLD